MIDTALLLTDAERFASEFPDNLSEIILERYGLNLGGFYGPFPVANIIGKGSGQLSLNLDQIKADEKAGLGFVVLKTLIGENESGAKSMGAWSEPASRMKVERITAKRGDAPYPEGWTVTWRGRGWSGTMEEYLLLFRGALQSTERLLIIPSIKCSLPSSFDESWHQDEYDYTLSRLLSVWQSERSGPMPIEKDFSPTLAGDRTFSSERSHILNWLSDAPKHIERAVGAQNVHIGVKLFNTRFSEDFQVEALRALEDSDAADWIVYGNRLFDPELSFLGEKGAAYGGPDLLAQNLSVLRNAKGLRKPLSATGGINSGRDILQYAAEGASSFQLHTFFQIPNAEYTTASGSRTHRALHTLLFHSNDGLLPLAARYHQRRSSHPETLRQLSEDCIKS